MRGEKFGEAATKSAGAVSMNDAHVRQAFERSGVKKFVDTARGFFNGVADYVDFAGGRLVGASGGDGDTALRGGCGGTRRRGRFDAENIGERNLHAHGASLNLCGIEIVAAKDHRVFHSPDANAHAFGELFR